MPQSTNGFFRRKRKNTTPNKATEHDQVRHSFSVLVPCSIKGCKQTRKLYVPICRVHWGMVGITIKDQLLDALIDWDTEEIGRLNNLILNQCEKG